MSNLGETALAASEDEKGCRRLSVYNFTPLDPFNRAPEALSRFVTISHLALPKSGTQVRLDDTISLATSDHMDNY